MTVFCFGTAETVSVAFKNDSSVEDIATEWGMKKSARKWLEAERLHGREAVDSCENRGCYCRPRHHGQNRATRRAERIKRIGTNASG